MQQTTQDMTKTDDFDAILGQHCFNLLSKKVCRTFNLTGISPSKTFRLIAALHRRPLRLNKAGTQHPGSNLTCYQLQGRGLEVSSLTTRYESAVWTQKRVCQGGQGLSKIAHLSVHLSELD